MRLCFYQLYAHILECQQNSKRSKMCASACSWSLLIKTWPLTIAPCFLQPQKKNVSCFAGIITMNTFVKHDHLVKQKWNSVEKTKKWCITKDFLLLLVKIRRKLAQFSSFGQRLQLVQERSTLHSDKMVPIFLVYSDFDHFTDKRNW